MASRIDSMQGASLAYLLRVKVKVAQLRNAMLVPRVNRATSLHAAKVKIGSSTITMLKDTSAVLLPNTENRARVFQDT